MINATLTVNTPSDNSGGLMSRGAGGAGGAGAGAGGRGPGDVQSQGGAMDAIVDMLGDTLIQMLFQKNSDGATFDNPGNNPLMDMISEYMDRNPGYHSPDDATGNVRSWKDEMSEDNFLNKQELSDFTDGLKGFLTSLLSGDWSSLGGELGSLAGGMAGTAMGGPAGGMVGSAVGGTAGSLMGGVVDNRVGDFGGGGMQGGQSPMAQNGFSMGSSFASHVGKTAIDSIDIKQTGFRPSEMDLNGGERFSIDGADKDIARDVAKFMDQNPEKYGPAPKNGGWAGRIEQGKDFNQDEIDRFKQGMSDLKDVMDGKSTGDQQTDMDARLASNSIVSDSMYKLSA